MSCNTSLRKNEQVDGMISGSRGDPVPAHPWNLAHSEPRPHAEQTHPPDFRPRPQHGLRTEEAARFHGRRLHRFCLGVTF